jgi:hypothetical protein
MPQKESTTSGASKNEDGNVSGLREDRLRKQQGNTGFGVADTILTVANRQRHRGPRLDTLGFCRSLIADMPSTSVLIRGS